MSRRIVLLATLLTLALAAPAAAQTDPFGPLPQAAPTETVAPVATATPTDDNSTNRTTLYLIGAVLVLGFAAMGFFIARDARSKRPELEYAGSRLRDEGPHKHKRQAKARARAKGRAQRASRKKNR
jgi:uncharacterized protein HemX